MKFLPTFDSIYKERGRDQARRTLSNYAPSAYQCYLLPRQAGDK